MATVRPPRALKDGEELELGRHRLRWFDTPHMPHSWECGLLMDASTRTPATLAWMHGSAWRGDGSALLFALAAALAARPDAIG